MGRSSMVDDRSSPSAGWREVYAEMEVSTSIEDDEAACPDCGDRSPRIFRGVYHCERHGYWRDEEEAAG